MSFGLFLAIINVMVLVVAVLFKQDISTIAAFTALQLAALGVFLSVAALGDVRKLIDRVQKGTEHGTDQ